MRMGTGTRRGRAPASGSSISTRAEDSIAVVAHLHIVAPTHATNDGYLYVRVSGTAAGAYSIAFRKTSTSRNLLGIRDVDDY